MTADIFASTLKTLAKSLGHSSFPTATFVLETSALKLLAISNLKEDSSREKLPQHIDIKPDHLQKKLQGDGKVFSVSRKTTINPELFDFASQLGFEKVAFLPVASNESLYGLVMVGSYKGQALTKKALHPYSNAVQLANIVLEQAAAIKQVEALSVASESATEMSQSLAASGNLEDIFSILHEQVRQTIGDYSLMIALYDETTNSIRIPYVHGEEEVKSIEALPLGEGLTSTLIRTKQPLMLEKDIEKQAEALGEKTLGKPAKSWLGVPLLVKDKAIGSIILKDLEREGAFTDSNLQVLSALAQQAAGFVYNAGIVDDLRQQLFQIQTTAEVARDISSALNLDELLLRAINLLHERFNFYHASIFLIDAAEKNAVIREAAGEAGALMKRTGHKYAIDSKSIVGFVAEQGESLLVNDIISDTTYLPNPMLPDTRAEAAIPLKIGDRILGVLDVQSTIPYSFTPSDIDIFQILADQLAIAVNNTELFANAQDHLSQHRLLHHITTSAASGTTLAEALTATVEGLQVTLGGDRVSILLSDEERKNLVVKAWVGYSEEAENLSIPFGSGITGWVAARRKPLRIDDITQDARYIQVSSNTRSELALPLIFRNDILGVLNVESEQVAAYTENDEEMLGTLAGSLAAIIANARLVRQIRKQAERERQLYEITSKIRRSTDVQTILSTTIKELNRATGARRTQITVGIPEGDTASLPNAETEPGRE